MIIWGMGYGIIEYDIMWTKYEIEKLDHITSHITSLHYITLRYLRPRWGSNRREGLDVAHPIMPLLTFPHLVPLILRIDAYWIILVMTAIWIWYEEWMNCMVGTVQYLVRVVCDKLGFQLYLWLWWRLMISAAVCYILYSYICYNNMMLHTGSR